MPVIKQQTASTFVRDAIVLDMSDLRAQADRIRSAAEAEAQRILADARTKAAELATASESEARQKGHELGLKQGLEEGRKSGHAEALSRSAAQLAQIQKAWVDAAAAFDAQRDAMERQVADAVLRLALVFAEKVVRRTAAVDSQTVVRQLSDAISYVLRPCDVKVSIHPDDRPVLEQAMPQLLAGLANLKHMQLIDDDSLSRGGCVLAYGQGRIDATIDTQLRRLVEMMLPDGATAPASAAEQSPASDREPPDSAS